jgi:hypothetical protein
MTFVIYNRKTFFHVKSFRTERGAKIALSRKYDKNEFAVTSALNWKKEFEPKIGYKEVTVLTTGKKVMIRKDTPRCCDPSSELYWSM